MLSLTDEIDSDQPWIGRFISENQSLRRTGEEIDSNAAEQLSFRLCDKPITRTHD